MDRDLLADISLEEKTSKPLSTALAIGLGREGIRVINTLKQMPHAQWLQTAVIDTDSADLKQSAADYKISASSDWAIHESFGCGGDVLRGERAIARERNNIQALLDGISLLVVTGGLGGGTATGGLRTVASLARSAGIPAVFLVTTPFSFESYSRRKNAEDCISELMPITDVLLTIPNDLLFMKLPPDVAAEEAYTAAAEELAGIMAGIADVLRCRNFFGCDYAVLMNTLKQYRCSCAVGVGVAETHEGLDYCSLALERMLDAPFLGGLKQLERADAVLFILSGGRELEIGVIKRSMELFSGMLPREANVVMGCNTSAELEGRIQMTVIAVSYDKSVANAAQTVSRKRRKTWSPGDLDIPTPVVRGNDVILQPSVKKHSKQESFPGNGTMQQGELDLMNFSKGIFEKCPPNRYRDEDLDIPTFQRKNITIDAGV